MKSFKATTAAGLVFGSLLAAGPGQALIPPCLPEYEDCWREGLETDRARIVTESKEQVRRAKLGEWKAKADRIESNARQARVLRSILLAYLHRDPQEKLVLQRSGWVEADFTGIISQETTALLVKFPFLWLTLRTGGGDLWGIGAQLKPGSVTGQFLALRDELYQHVENAIHGSGGANPEAAEIGLWACETEVLLTPGKPAVGIFSAEQCHLLFS